MKKLLLALLVVLTLTLSGCSENDEEYAVLQEMEEVSIYSECDLVKWSLSQRVSCYDETKSFPQYGIYHMPKE